MEHTDFEQPPIDLVADVHEAVYIEVWKTLLDRDDVTDHEARLYITHLMYEDNEMAGNSPIRQQSEAGYGVFDDVGVGFHPDNAAEVVNRVIERLEDDRDTWETIHEKTFESEYEDEQWHWGQFIAKLKRRGLLDLIPTNARIPIEENRDLVDDRFVSDIEPGAYNILDICARVGADDVVRVECDLGTFWCRPADKQAVRIRTEDDEVRAAVELWYVNQLGPAEAEQHGWMVNREVDADLINHWLTISQSVTIERVAMTDDRYW